jgi:hypothetical protein
MRGCESRSAVELLYQTHQGPPLRVCLASKRTIAKITNSCTPESVPIPRVYAVSARAAGASFPLILKSLMKHHRSDHKAQRAVGVFV